LSRDEYQVDAMQRFNAVPGAAGDDEDEELLRAIAMSEAEARAPKRQKREETPEEERRQLAE
jgi:tyrosyl-DNA phosphodiesterase-1